MPFGDLVVRQRSPLDPAMALKVIDQAVSVVVGSNKPSERFFDRWPKLLEEFDVPRAIKVTLERYNIQRCRVRGGQEVGKIALPSIQANQRDGGGKFVHDLARIVLVTRKQAEVLF